jgi:hypothetical protein
MIERAIDAGVPFGWFAADGDNGQLCAWLESRRVPYVLAVSCDLRVPSGAGRTIRADELAARPNGLTHGLVIAGRRGDVARS